MYGRDIHLHEDGIDHSRLCACDLLLSMAGMNVACQNNQYEDSLPQGMVLFRLAGSGWVNLVVHRLANLGI
jgi:hypothetical protein